MSPSAILFRPSIPSETVSTEATISPRSLPTFVAQLAVFAAAPGVFCILFLWNQSSKLIHKRLWQQQVIAVVWSRHLARTQQETILYHKTDDYSSIKCPSLCSPLFGERRKGTSLLVLRNRLVELLQPCHVTLTVSEIRKFLL